MHLTEFDFELPEELIAKNPTDKRDTSRLLVARRKNKEVSHHTFSEIAIFLNPQDLLVLNNTKVIPARLFGKTKHGGEIEILLIDPIEFPNQWKCLVKPGRKVRNGLEVFFKDKSRAEVNRTGDEFTVRFLDKTQDSFYDWLDSVGRVPLPPYIKRESNAEDKVNYQTVYAKEKGSVAAPTAGLHFTEALLEEIKAKGVETLEVTLHVGYGTFSPIQVSDIRDHKMHFESYSAPRNMQDMIHAARSRGGRVVAVGTTSLRTLESIPQFGSAGKTNLFISPGYKFQNIDALVTNFHTPRSSLFVLVSSLLGVEWAKEIYRTAIQNKYRFFSYGDAMLIVD